VEDADFPALHSRNYNESDEVRNYVDGYLNSRKGAPPPAPSAPAVGADPWDACGSSAIARINGSADPGLGFQYNWHRADRAVPLSKAITFEYSVQPSLSMFYGSGEIGPCYGTTIDEASLQDARTNKDMCRARFLSATACAPGWDKEAYANLAFCVPFQQCVAAFKSSESRYLAIGAQESADPSQHTTYTLAEGWNDVAGAEAQPEAEFRQQWMTLSRMLGSEALTVDSIFLGVTALGLVLLTSGLVVEVTEDKKAVIVPFQKALPELTITGATALFVASIGFLVYDSLSLSEIAGFDVIERSFYLVPGGGRILRDCSISLTVFSSVLTVLTLGTITVWLLKINIPGFAISALWFSIIILFLGELIPSAIGLHVARTFESWMYHGSNYNRSDAVKAYVDAVSRYPPGDITPLTKTGPGLTKWDVCGLTDAEFAALANAAAGTLDRTLSSFTYFFSVPGINPPWNTSKTFLWYYSIDWSDLYQESVVAGCYGTLWDKESVAKAQAEQDLCQLKLASVQDCAPGWSESLIDDLFCAQYKNCQAEFERDMSRWATFGAESVSSSDQSQTFQLPVGWKRLDDFEDSADAVLQFQVRQLVLTTPWFWLVVHAPLLGIACVGWALVVIGLICLVTASEANKPFSELMSQGLLATSSYT
jgi:hypothetical protein